MVALCVHGKSISMSAWDGAVLCVNTSCMTSLYEGILSQVTCSGAPPTFIGGRADVRSLNLILAPALLLCEIMTFFAFCLSRVRLHVSVLVYSPKKVPFLLSGS